MIVNRVEQHIIKKNNVNWSFIDKMCLKSKNLYNYANYLIRQEFIKSNKCISYNDVFKLCKNEDCYLDIGSNTGQATLRMLDKTWKSFLVAIKDWSKSPLKYFGKPKLPKYLKKDGRYVLALDNNKVGIKGDKIYFKWKIFKFMNNTFITKIPTNAKIMQCRFIPKGSCYVMEIVYQIEVPDTTEQSENIASIDLGVDNFITMVNSIGVQPIAVKGGVIKSINQYYNKKKAKLQSELMKVNKQHWSKQLQKLTDDRYEKIKYQMHCISKYVVDWCVMYGIDTLVVGRNKGWKQENDGKQNFTYIPYEMFENMLQYKCENNGIKCILVNESYTSATSFLDNEQPCKENYDKSRRVHRGLFVSNNGTKINADVNGAYQIMKKVIPDAFAKGIEGVGLHPTVIQMSNREWVTTQ